MYSDYIYLYDKKGAGINAGGSTSGAWRTRDITDEVFDTGNICTLASNQFTLDAGTYRVMISAPAKMSTHHSTRLYNITDTAMELRGTSEYLVNAAARQSRSFITGRFTIATQKTFEVQYRVAYTRPDEGLGLAIAWGDNIYTVVELWKEGTGTEETIFGPKIQVV